MLNKPFICLLMVSVYLLLNGCSYLEEKQQESNDAIDSTSLIYQIKKGEIHPINPEVFKELIQIKHLLPTPIAIPQGTVERQNPVSAGMVLTDPCYDNPRKKQVIKACDYSSSIVRNTSIQIAANNPGPYNIGQLCDLFDFSLKRWTYINDPIFVEYVAKASETIEQNYTGDCDDFAVILGSMIMSIGGDIRLNHAWNDTSGHAFVEANLGRIDLASTCNYLRQRYNIDEALPIHYRIDSNTQNVWLNMDWFAKHPGGRYFGHHTGIRFFVAYHHCESYSIDALGKIKVYKN
jgi:hypothetical protein